MILSPGLFISSGNFFLFPVSLDSVERVILFVVFFNGSVCDLLHFEVRFS